MLALALLLAAPEGRATLGVWGSWGAFRDRTPARCFAIAAPVRTGRGGRPFASLASRFGRDGRSALFVRLSAAANPAAPVVLAIGERRFALSAAGTSAWAPDAKTDHAIVQAVRGGRSMSVSAVSDRGRPFADVYALAGAATAIDAAQIGCARG